MPSVGVHDGENILSGSGLSALSSRKGTYCSHMIDSSMPRKKATFFLETGPRAEGKLKCQKEQVELGCVGHRSLPLRKRWKFWCLVLSVGFVFLHFWRLDIFMTLKIRQLQNNRELLSQSNYNFVCIE